MSDEFKAWLREICERHRDALEEIGWTEKAKPPYVPVEMRTMVEVVRCKDCKYGHRLTDVNGYNYRICNYPWGHGMMVEECGFCKWGKRRE